MEKDTYYIYGITEDFQKELIIECKKEDRDTIQHFRPSYIGKNFLFFISDSIFVEKAPFDGVNGYVYHIYNILNSQLEEKPLTLNNYLINSRIRHHWVGKMSNQFVEFKLEDTRNAKEIILRMTNSGDIDRIIDGLRLIKNYGLTSIVLDRINTFK